MTWRIICAHTAGGFKSSSVPLALNHDAGQDGTTEKVDAGKAAAGRSDRTTTISRTTSGTGGGRWLRQPILHLCRNLRYFSPSLMKFLQKYILCADFCFQPIVVAEIPAVLQECR